VTILVGTASEPFYAPIARAVVAHVPGARLVTFEGFRHPAPITDPEPVAAAILDAIADAGITDRSAVGRAAAPEVHR
jgi:pimeloyl-ACP methyl ester carboxylesterase